MPSTTSSSLVSPEPSSTVITPSLPTFSIASAMVLPIDSSAFAEMVPTWAISLGFLQGFESFLSSSTAAVTPFSMPRLMSIGLRPEETALRPSRMIACASTVAVVVPSPASSEVLDATSFTICAPMFSNLSFSSISFATETPSLVTVGAPKLLSRTALRPLGPRVTFTAFARMFTPLNMRCRASSLKRTSLAAIFLIPLNYLRVRVDGLLALDDGHHVFFTHDHELFTVHLHFGAAVLAEQDLVADLEVERANFAVLQNLALAVGDHLPEDRLLSRGIRDHDATGGLTLFFFAFDDHAVMKGSNLHKTRLLNLERL